MPSLTDHLYLLFGIVTPKEQVKCDMYDSHITQTKEYARGILMKLFGGDKISLSNYPVDLWKEGCSMNLVVLLELIVLLYINKYFHLSTWWILCVQDSLKLFFIQLFNLSEWWYNSFTVTKSLRWILLYLMLPMSSQTSHRLERQTSY